MARVTGHSATRTATRDDSHDSTVRLLPKRRLIGCCGIPLSLESLARRTRWWEDHPVAGEEPDESPRLRDETESERLDRKGLLHDQVTVSVTRPDWPVWS